MSFKCYRCNTHYDEGGMIFMATFEEQFPSLNGKRKDILGDRTGQEWSGFYIDEDDVKAHCLDKQRVIDVVWDLLHAMQNCHGDLMITREKQLELLKRFEELNL